jgi:hypothetical protein
LSEEPYFAPGPLNNVVDGDEFRWAERWGPAGTAVPKQIAGRVNSSGTVGAGSGFASSRNDRGEYTLNFPSGTFNGSTPPIPVVTPESSGLAISLFPTPSFQGAYSMNVSIETTGSFPTAFDSAFFFLVTQS